MHVIIPEHIENLYKDLERGNGEEFAVRILSTIADKVTDSFIEEGVRRPSENDVQHRLVLACKLARQLRNDQGYSIYRVCDELSRILRDELSGRGFSAGNPDDAWAEQSQEEKLIWTP